MQLNATSCIIRSIMYFWFSTSFVLTAFIGSTYVFYWIATADHKFKTSKIKLSRLTKYTLCFIFNKNYNISKYYYDYIKNKNRRRSPFLNPDEVVYTTSPGFRSLHNSYIYGKQSQLQKITPQDAHRANAKSKYFSMSSSF